MTDPSEKKELLRHFSNRARKPAFRGRRLLVPKKYDASGELIAPPPNGHLTSSQLFNWNLDEARFLKAWKESDWDFDKACELTHSEPSWARKLIGSVNAVNYRQEEQRDALLAQIPNKTWVTARYTEAALGLSDPSETQQWGLDRVREIVIPKAAPNVQINNVLAMPALSEDTLAQLKAIAHKEALESTDEYRAA